jgi:general secretion pathway protein F
MRPFSYVAYDAAGARARGMILPDTEADAAAQLKNRGLFVSELSAARSGPSSSWRTHLSLRRTTRLGRDLQAVFTRQMAVLLGADLPVEAALEAVRSSGDSTPLTALAEALERAGAGFPAYVIAAIHAGESSGALAPVFEELAEHLETLGNEKAEIVSALVYPGFVAAADPECAGCERLDAGQCHAAGGLAGRGCCADPAVLPTVASAGVAGSVFLRLPLVGWLMRRSAVVQYLRTLALVLASRQTVPVATENAARVLSVAQFNREGHAV